MDVVAYHEGDSCVSWSGVGLTYCDEFESFLKGPVLSRLHDEEGKADFQEHLTGLATTGFAADSLKAVLAAEVSEERDWAVGESIAEAWLEGKHAAVWPWNLERDKKTPMTSLPGADLVGFVEKEGEIHLALGEVKSSTDAKSPPNVMYGRSGMTHQLENLATDLSLIVQLIKWLLPRCKGTVYLEPFNRAVSLFLQSGNKSICLYGILVRDVEPSDLDLKSRGEHLQSIVSSPSSCELIALYLPCPISDLPGLISQGGDA